MTLLMLLLTAATAWADVTTIVEDDDEHNLVNPVFTGVTVSNAKHDYDNHADDDIATARQLTAFNICFSDGATTGILATDLTDYTEMVDAWYSLDGRKPLATKTAGNAGFNENIYSGNGSARSRSFGEWDDEE